MNHVSKLVLIAIVGGLSLSGPAFAQNAPATTPMAKTHSPQSIECSKQADAKGLHGAERKKFRKACMKGAGGMGKSDVD
jgi:hypothetical protein